MARWKFSPLRLGVWGMLALSWWAWDVAVGSGRIPSIRNFPGGEALNPPGNIRAQETSAEFC